MYSMCAVFCSFSALNRWVGALQLSITITVHAMHGLAIVECESMVCASPVCCLFHYTNLIQSSETDVCGPVSMKFQC